MNFDRRNSKNKWTIMQYLRDFDLMIAFAYALRKSSQNLSSENLLAVLDKLNQDGIYNPTSKHPNKDAKNATNNINTANFRVIQLAWYMFGYYEKNIQELGKRFVFSPLGNLLLDNLNNKEKSAKIFLTMLFSLPFKQHFSQMNSCFNLYPYRIVFKLLTEERLGRKLYIDELFYMVFFIKTITPEIYNDLIEEILSFRKKTSKEKMELFKKQEGVIALSLQEAKYFCGMLASAGVIEWKKNNNTLGRLAQGVITRRHAKKTTYRAYKQSEIKLLSSVENYVNKLLNSYSFLDIPYSTIELQNSFGTDIVLRMYNFYPIELLSEIGSSNVTVSKLNKILETIKQIEPHSKNCDGNNTGEKFEIVLKDVFNFFDDVEAVKIGGAGNSDIECIFYINESDSFKFDVEAKSRRKRLQEILPLRLEKHRKKIGSNYTIIVAPNYSRGVLDDIANAPNTIVKSSIFAQYMSQYILSSYKSTSQLKISYSFLHRMVKEHLGEDISPYLYSYIIQTFGHNYLPSA